MTFNCCENLREQMIERPGLFADNFRNARCSKSMNVSENILNKIEIAIKYFTKSLMAKNCPTQIAPILFTLADLPRILASEKRYILFMLLKEATKDVARCCQILEEPPAHIQTKTLLNLMSNFIREWGERPCEVHSHLKICRFCDSIINDEARQYTRKFCRCEAKHFDRLRNEWISLHVSQVISLRKLFSFDGRIHCFPLLSRNTSKCESVIFPERKIDYRNENIPREEENAAEVRRSPRLISANKNDVSILLCERQCENRADFQMKTNPSSSSGARDMRQRDVSLVPAEVSAREIERPAGSVREAGHRRGIGREDPSEANGDRSLRRGKTEASAGGARSDGGAKNTDTLAERIRERRDNNPYRRELGEIGDKDRQDRRSAQRDVQEEGASGSRIAAGKSDGDTGDVKTKENGAVRGDPRPYQRGRREERGTRLSDNGAEKIGRSDRAEQKSASTEISRNPAKRLAVQRDGDRRENEEKPVAREDKKKAGSDKDEGTTLLNPSNPIEYRLSNVHFVKLGWTSLPITKSMRKIVQYEARPAKPNLWFKKYGHKGTVYYDDGTTLFLKFHSDGSSEIFYPNGILAIRVYRPENRKYDMYTVFAPGGKDALGIERASQILAIFDTMGNGVVLDEDGAARLSYNQIGGIFTDNPAGLPLAWTWRVGPKEPILETVYTEKFTDQLQMKFAPAIDEQANSSGNVKTPISQSSSRNKEKKVVEVRKPVVEQRQEGEVESKLNDNRDSSGKNTFHIKIICMKLNEFLSLRIIDQKNISLQFSVKNKRIRIELGTILNFNKEVASYVVEASDWKSDLLKCRFQENLSKKLESDSSLCDLAKEYRKVKRYAKERKAMIAKYRFF
ncbi:uncharacterized protein [Linepithema humile]|uniref:uncharacterized protein isoform X2 n=1 Tax=Linepithema humile TaxID=83485 RepID=UPI00351EA8AC